MSDLRKRGPDGTLQRRIFLLLRDHASMTVNGLTETIGNVSRNTVKLSVWLLENRGYLAHRRLGRSTAHIYHVMGSTPPRDLRGKLKPCTREYKANAYAQWLRMMAKRHGQAWRPPMKPGIALEECWPSRHAQLQHQSPVAQDG